MKTILHNVASHNLRTPWGNLSSLAKAIVVSTAFVPALLACTHTVKIDPSDKPILININLNIQQEIRVSLEKDIEDMLANNPDVF